MPIYEVEHITWVAFREFTLVRANSRDEAEKKFDLKYDGRNIDLKFATPEAINIALEQTVKYPFKLSDDVEILE